MKISRWLKSHPASAMTARYNTSLDEVVDLFLEQPCRHNVYVLSEDDRVIGHLSCGRIFHLLLAEHRPVYTRRQIMERVSAGTAQELMDSHIVSAHPDEELDNVIHRQLEHDLEEMPVIDDGRLLGVINIRDVMREYRKKKKR